MIIVPSTAVETMGLGAIGALIAFSHQPKEALSSEESISADLYGK